jgi:hypothetical protein
MPTFDHKYVLIPADKSKYGKDQYFHALSKTSFDRFTAKALGLGNILDDRLTILYSSLAVIFRQVLATSILTWTVLDSLDDETLQVWLQIFDETVA